MDRDEARTLIESAVTEPGGVWADLGSGAGTFTRALAELLGPEARIYAVDRDERALSRLASRVGRTPAEVIPVTGDFTEPLELPGVAAHGLDGILLANALHFVSEPGPVLARLVESWVRPGGSVVVVEYDRRRADPWVPYPIPLAAVRSVAAEAGLTEPTIAAVRPSAYGGSLYVAVAFTRSGSSTRPPRRAP